MTLYYADLPDKVASFEDDPSTNANAPAKMWRDGKWVDYEYNLAGKLGGGDWEQITAEQAAEITGERAETP